MVFLSDRAGEFDIWLSQVGTGIFRNLTQDVPSLPPGANYTVRALGFTGDGSEVWFRHSVFRRMMAMPLIGGTPRAFLGELANTPSWSKDGSSMVYFNSAGPMAIPLFVANAAGVESRQIFVSERGLHNHNLIWSTDGQWIYFVHGDAETDEWTRGGFGRRAEPPNDSLNATLPCRSWRRSTRARSSTWPEAKTVRARGYGHSTSRARFHTG